MGLLDGGGGIFWLAELGCINFGVVSGRLAVALVQWMCVVAVSLLFVSSRQGSHVQAIEGAGACRFSVG